MSVKFERDTFQRTAQNAANGAANAMPSSGPIPGTSGKHPFAETVGTALTGGKQNAGTKGYLAVRQSSSMLASVQRERDAVATTRAAARTLCSLRAE